MATIYGANSVSGYDVANSLRLNSGDSAQMNKTLGTATNVDKYTISMWVKRSRLAHRQMMMRVINPSSTSTYAFLEFQSDDSIGTNDYDGSGSIAKVTHAKFRDPSAWYHIVLALDSTQGTASNRSKLYVNGTQITNFSTDSGGSQNQDLIGNTSGKNIYIGGDGGQDARYCGLYMAEVCFIDGQQLDPTSFGEFDSDTPTIWKPIDVSGLTFGNNGFYLDFEDSSNLGNDANGGTDLTETSLAATDQSTDTCTNNFCTFNPLDVTADDEATLSEGNLKAVADGAFHQTRSTFYLTTGKWYWEFKATSVGDALQGGVVGSNYAGGSGLRRNYQHSAAKYTDGSSSSYGATFTDGDIIGVALDLDNGTLIFYKNGSTQGTAFTDMLSAIGEDGWTPDVIMYNSTAEMNFGSPSYSESGGNSDANGHGNFAGSVPSGYFALCTKNLAESG